MPLSTMTDLEIVEEARGGNHAAFRALYYRYVDAVFGLVTRILGPQSADREDVVQEVFLGAHRALGRFRGDASFSTWLHRIAIHVAYSHLRRSSRTKTAPYLGRYGTESIETCVNSEGERQLDARRAVRQMYELIDKLSPKNRIVFVLYEFEGLTLDRISEALHIPLHTAAARLRRSREILMQLHRTEASADQKEKK